MLHIFYLSILSSQLTFIVKIFSFLSLTTIFFSLRILRVVHLTHEDEKSYFLFIPMLVFVEQGTGQECLLCVCTGTSSSRAGAGSLGLWCSGDSPPRVTSPYLRISHFYLFCYISKNFVLEVNFKTLFFLLIFLLYDCRQITEFW